MDAGLNTFLNGFSTQLSPFADFGKSPSSVSIWFVEMLVVSTTHRQEHTDMLTGLHAEIGCLSKVL